MCMIFGTIVFFFILVLGYKYVGHYVYSIRDDLPGCKPQIIFGNLINSGFLTGKITFQKLMVDYQRRYGDKFVFWFGPLRCPVFCLPEHAQLILNDKEKFEKSQLFLPNFDLLCPSGIITLTGATWRRHMRVILPMLRIAKIKHHLDTIIQCTDDFVDHQLIPNHVHTDLLRRCEILSMNIMGVIAFDHQFSINIHSSLKEAFEVFLFYANFTMLTSWLPRWTSKLLLRLNWKYQWAYNRIRKCTNEIIEHEKQRQFDVKDDQRKNLIASLVASLNEQATDQQVTSGLTKAELFDEILVTILAAHGTTSTVLAWLFFYLSKHVDVQERLKDELKQHCLLECDDSQNVASLTMENLDHLTYCECVIKEVLRLAPAAGITSRKATCDTVVDHVSIVQDQTVFVALHNASIDARYWHYADPMDFVPERFLGCDKNHHPYAMLPFGSGHRSCIGQDMAYLELKIILVRLMQRKIHFQDTPDNTGGYAARLTCYPKNMAVRIAIDPQT